MRRRDAALSAARSPVPNHVCYWSNEGVALTFAKAWRYRRSDDGLTREETAGLNFEYFPPPPALALTQ